MAERDKIPAGMVRDVKQVADAFKRYFSDSWFVLRCNQSFVVGRECIERCLSKSKQVNIVSAGAATDFNIIFTVNPVVSFDRSDTGIRILRDGRFLVVAWENDLSRVVSAAHEHTDYFVREATWNFITDVDSVFVARLGGHLSSDERGELGKEIKRQGAFNTLSISGSHILRGSNVTVRYSANVLKDLGGMIGAGKYYPLAYLNTKSHKWFLGDIYARSRFTFKPRKDAEELVNILARPGGYNEYLRSLNGNYFSTLVKYSGGGDFRVEYDGGT